MANAFIPPPINPALNAKLGMQNPFMPPPAPSPSLGFQAWASDPQNAHKVMTAMTDPNAPLQPNAGQQQPSQMASLNPPKPAPMASAVPPEISQPLVLPDTQPSMFTAPKPQVQSGAQAQLGTDQAELQRLQQSGAAANHIKNPVLRTLAQVGNIAAPFLLGRGAMAIPGTTAHNLWLQDQAQGRVSNDQDTVAAQQKQLMDAANLEHTNAETAAIPVTAGLKKQQYLAGLASKGLKEDENGNIVPDESSPVFQQEQTKNETLQAQAEYTRAGIALRQAQTEFEKTKNDPNSPAYKLAMQKLAVAQQNASAAGQRAQAYMGRYMQSAYNVGLNGDVLPGATQIADDSGNETVVGTGNASQATKAQGNAARFNDVHGALDSIENSARALVNSGGSLNSARVAAALAEPPGTLGKWLQANAARSGMTPEERAYVQAIAAGHENVQALRSSVGGGVSDAQVNRLDALVPGAATPDLGYLLGQTGQIRATAERLGKGATTATGGLEVRGRGGSNPMKPPTTGGPKEGDVKTNSAGDKVKFHGGNWGPA